MADEVEHPCTPCAFILKSICHVPPPVETFYLIDADGGRLLDADDSKILYQ